MSSLKKRPVKFLDLTPKSAQRKKLTAVFNKVLLAGNFILGKEVKNFENQFAKYLGIKHCIGVGNGLEAIQISLMSLGIGKNDEVITTPVSAVATTLAILAVGAKPVFVDTTKDGLLDPALIVPAINKKTKAILPVHLYGNPVDLNKIQKLCKKYKLSLIEDAAQAHGSIYNGKKIGTFGELCCFSFYPTKNLGALGDGGAVVTNSKRLAKICREIRDYGQDKKYLHIRFGLNSRLDELQASFLSVRLKSLDTDNSKRRKLAQRYTKNLSSLKDIEIVKPDPNAQSNWHLFVIKAKKRTQLIKYLQRFSIQTLVHFPKIIPDQPFLKSKYGKLNLPVSRMFTKTCLSLPIHPKLNFKEIDFICSKVVKFYT